jgi:hypothetical protein
MNTLMRVLGVFCLGLVLQGCHGKVNVPAVRIAAPMGMEPVPGRYAALVQSGGWKLDVKSNSYTCSAWSFDTDINASYRTAMQEALTQGLQKVDFIEETLTPEDLQKRGYAAQIVLYQGSATAQFGVSQNMFSGTAGSGVELTSTLALIGPKGLAYQATVTGQGSGGRDVFSCATIGEAIGVAAAGAIQDMGSKSVLYIRDAVRSSQAATTPEPAKTAAPLTQ